MDATIANKRMLFVFRHGPHGGSLGRDALEALLAAGAYDQAPAVLFLDDGVWQLLPAQQGQRIGGRNHPAMLGALPHYGIEQRYVDVESLATRGIDAATLNIEVTAIDRAAVKALLAASDVILGF